VSAPLVSDSVVGLVLGAGWAVVVVDAVSGKARRRARRLPPPAAPEWPALGRGTATARLRGRSPVVVLGSALRRLVTPAVTRSAAAVDVGADRRAGWAAIAAGALVPTAPALAAVPVVVAVAAPVLAGRRDRAREEAQLHDQLPDVVDLLALTTAAGLPIGAALVAIAGRPGGPLGATLARAGALVRHGGSTGEALALLGGLSPAVRPLVDALVQHDRYGTPLLPALERVAIEARARRRRRAEEAARRLPVTLLFPLVLTTFPAFVLLTVVPLLAGSLGSLSLTPT
jgi:tight adherence protein C